MSTAEHSVSSAVRMAAVQLDARVGQIARALSQVPERQSGDACSLASRCWSFCAAPPLEQYTGSWLDERAASPPLTTGSTRSRKQAILEGLCEGMVVEGKVTAIEDAALLVRLRKVRLLSPGGSFVRPPEHLRHLWQLQIIARCNAAELADDVVSSRARAAHLLGRFVPGDHVRGIILRVCADAALIASGDSMQQQQPAPQLELSFRDTLVRALYAAGAPDLGLFSPSASSYRSVLSSSSSDSDDDVDCGDGPGHGSLAAAQSVTHGYGRGRKRKRSQPPFNSVLESEAAFANPYAVESMASSFGLRVSCPQGGSSKSRDPGLEALPSTDEISTTASTVEDTLVRTCFKQGRSFSFVLQNSTRTIDKYGARVGGEDDDGNGGIPEYLVLRKQQNYTHAADAVARGVSCAKRGDYTGAMKHYSYALHIDKTHAEAYVARGAAYANQGMLSKAVGEFEYALRLLPDTRTEHPATHCNDGRQTGSNSVASSGTGDEAAREHVTTGPAKPEAGSASASARIDNHVRPVDNRSQAKARTRANATLYLAATRKKLAEEEKKAAKEAAIAEEAARLKREQQAEIAAIKARKAKEAAEEQARRREMEKPIPAPSLASLLSEMKEKVSKSSSSKKRKKDYKKKHSKKHSKKHRNKKKKKKEKKAKHRSSKRKSDESDEQPDRDSDSPSSSSSSWGRARQESPVKPEGT